MSFTKEYRKEIMEFIIQSVSLHKNPYQSVLEKYPISRQTLAKYIKNLIEKNIIAKVGRNHFELKLFIFDKRVYDNEGLAEHIIYQDFVKPYEADKKENVKYILNYAFTEILNNAIEHSEGDKIYVYYAENYYYSIIAIEDNGIGIFKKIKRDHHLKNESEAIFELKKGKLTSDSENHSGEGIFFTSKVVDYFSIESFQHHFSSGNKEYFYSFEQLEKNKVNGTCVFMVIDKNTNRTTKEVFEKYTNEEYVFDRTEITIHLAKEYLGFPLVSRSLAKRILSNIDKFKNVFLDFLGIDSIGQGFADEVFRVYRNKKPEITILPINENSDIRFMIERALKAK